MARLIFEGTPAGGSGQSAGPGGLSWPCLSAAPNQPAMAGRRVRSRLLAVCRTLRVNYGAVAALRGVSLHVGSGRGGGAARRQWRRQEHDAAHHLRAYRARAAGEIRFLGERIDRLPPARIVRLGIAHSPGRAARLRHPDGRGESAARRVPRAQTARHRRGPRTASTRLFPILKERTRQPAGTLSGGEQQMLALGRALMARPRCCCSTSPRSAWRPCSCSRSSRTPRRTQGHGRDHAAGRAEHRSWRSILPIAPMCCARARSAWRAARRA